MRVESAGFVLSAGSVAECPAVARAEIAVSGRSNVGKSSLLNSILGRRTLVKVSSTPGKTQRLNYFLVNEEFHLVDLPGYGYARVSGTARDQWHRMVHGYLEMRRQLVAVLQLVDARHAPSREDLQMVQWLHAEDMPFCLVATKIDRLAASKRQPALRTITEALELPETTFVLPYSSKTGQGRATLLAWIGAHKDLEVRAPARR